MGRENVKFKGKRYWLMGKNKMVLWNPKYGRIKAGVGPMNFKKGRKINYTVPIGFIIQI